MHKVHSADGAAIAYELTGHGLPLLVIHGDYVDHAQWSTALPFLAQDFAVYVMDRRGHGASDPYRAGHTLERDVEDVLALLEAIHEPAYLIGHATGAYIALEAAALHLEAYRQELKRYLAVDDLLEFLTIAGFLPRARHARMAPYLALESLSRPLKLGP